MDYNFDDDTRQQITAAFADWTNANRNNGSGITYVTGPRAPRPTPTR